MKTHTRQSDRHVLQLQPLDKSHFALTEAWEYERLEELPTLTIRVLIAVPIANSPKSK